MLSRQNLNEEVKERVPGPEDSKPVEEADTQIG